MISATRFFLSLFFCTILICFSVLFFDACIYAILQKNITLQTYGYIGMSVGVVFLFLCFNILKNVCNCDFIEDNTCPTDDHSDIKVGVSDLRKKKNRKKKKKRVERKAV